MIREIKLRQVGGSVGATLPRDMAARLHLAVGDSVLAVETDRGILLTPYDPVVEEGLAVAARASKRFRHALRELAKQAAPNVAEPRWVPRVVVEAVHFDQVRSHGGLAGLRDEAALESALARPRNRLAYGKKPDLATLAAAYAFGLARNHPFRDGNKRIAFLTAVIFLGLNGHELDADDADVVAQIVALADGRLSERRLASWMRAHLRRSPSGAAQEVGVSAM